MGGEKGLGFGFFLVCKGSPPHGRGKDAIQRHTTRCLGITPAWAGKSSCRCPCLRPEGDHPRMGGEKLLVLLSVGWLLGSPPHGRGKGIARDSGILLGGITPAWAGKRKACVPLMSRDRDHPRMGGEKPVAMHNLTTRAGSPPHGRGKGPSISRPAPASGITPAWAGKSCMSRWSRGLGRDHPRMGGEKDVVLHWSCN